jgi:hypothetical protein
MQLFQLLAERSLQLRQRTGFRQTRSGPGMLFDLQGALDLVEPLRDAARVRHLRERDK